MGNVQTIMKGRASMEGGHDALWLWTVMVFGIGSKRLWEMSDNFDSVEDFVSAVKNRSITGLTGQEYERADAVSIGDAEKILGVCSDRGQKYLCYESEGYPLQLKRIANPPAMLFYKGNLDFLHDKCLITVVGTRRPSQYSLEVTDKLCGELADRGFVLVSGFAEGIDQRVNLVSLEKGEGTVAVCGTPIDYDYPRGSGELKNKIAETGVVISEYYPTARFHSGSFSARNRISVGMSSGVLFIEARRESHGLDNYGHAVYQGKPVFVIPPHDIYDSRYFGQRDLLRNECQAVFGADDIVHAMADGKYFSMKYIRSEGKFDLPSEDSGFYSEQEKREATGRSSGKKHGKTEPEQTTVEKRSEYDFSGLDDTQSKICMLLKDKNMLVDEISAAAGLDISDTLALLTELEMEGAVRSLPGKMFGL
ncbi:MAG: DNA-processing protein DprA [Ruminococcus sp.]|nr:DNA-processing protein DprA [Ruminococcus sp.]